ncbi:MAG: GNAT family N-acetyltransferase [Ilumatobacter sp.]
MTAVSFPERDDGIVLRSATPDDFDAIIARDEQAFSGSFDEEQRRRTRESFVFERFVVAIDDTDLVGLAGSFDFDLTLPGGATVPSAGTTWVSVAPTHRRRGITRDMLSWVHADAIERGAAAAELMASEGSIYERFGYGVATRRRQVTIDRRIARLRPDVVDAALGTTRLVDPGSSIDAMHERYDRARHRRHGELSRRRQWMADHLAQVKQPFLALHDDGYVLWCVDEDWGDYDAQHTLRVVDLVAATPEAHRALWSLVMSIDLVRWVKSGRQLALDDPLPGLFVDQRSVQTTALADFLWLNPLRCEVLLSERRYRVSDELVVDVLDPASTSSPASSERWRISGGPDGAQCEPTEAEPDVTLSRAALGSLVLGGSTATELAATDRLAVSASTSLGRVDAFFGWAPLAHCATEF